MTQWDLNSLAASLRMDGDDLSLYAGFLMNTLSSALPANVVSVERKSGLFGRTREDAPVLGVSVTAGDERFVIRRKGVGQPAIAQIIHESGGIVLKTDTVAMDAWSHRLAAALAGLAQQNAAAATALARLTLPGQ
ncbi:hypothetical protein [Antrihabitans stalactiti]|uniref:Uncharacterized protein n=1 Tax=Antrihabitans stalactiti TaxID=2584121 RepID=A0A848KKS0_9NOCA|nr:hypothetical protein [Antrihabitans stalactiti]NMN98741.1 hypothetical protein [Antrihabitans stalactiti]